MAVNTAARRNSALKFGTLRGLPLPSGSVEEAARADGIFLYRGLYDSGSIPAASYPCPHAVVFHHAGPQATVSRLPAPEASVYQRVPPTAEIRGC